METVGLPTNTEFCLGLRMIGEGNALNGSVKAFTLYFENDILAWKIDNINQYYKNRNTVAFTQLLEFDLANWQMKFDNQYFFRRFVLSETIFMTYLQNEINDINA